MRMKTVGNKRDLLATVIHNAEASAYIQNGQPVCLLLSGGAGGVDGIDVILPSTAHGITAGLEFSTLYGVALVSSAAGIPPGGYGEAQVYGFCADVAFTQNTRSASSASWTSMASQACWVPLYPETVGNGWTTYATDSWVTSVSSNAAGSYAFPHYQCLLLPLSVSTGSTGVYSMPASATAASDTRTSIRVITKCYLRML